MLLDEKINDLQNLTKRKISYEELAPILGVGTANALRNWNYRKRPLKDFEIKKLDEAFNINSTNLNTISQSQDCTDIPVRGNVSASMGYGLTVYDETQTGTYSISNKLAKDLGINLNKSEIIFAKGDSMEPTIIGGDSLLIDLTRKEVHDGSIYCVRIDGELYAKRLQKLPPDKIKVISDNKDKYDPFYIDLSKNIDFDFEIIGEIRWWGRVAR